MCSFIFATMKKLSLAHQLSVAHFHIWVNVLLRNGFGWRQSLKIIWITLLTVIQIPFHLLNHIIFLLRRRNTIVCDDPVFIIGHWRSGTTFLQYLLSKDDQFGYLTYYQAFVPTLAFIGGKGLKRILSRGMPKKRPQDDVHLQADLPTEEENPLATMSSCSASHNFFFPRNEHYYRHFVLFEGTDEPIKNKWKKAYQNLLEQMAVRFSGRRLLIKNPHNTGRIKELYELYPKATFIYLYRHPYEVYPSTYLMYDRVVKTQYLQPFTDEETREKIMYCYRSILKRYYDTREEIPSDQLIEISYKEMLEDPMGCTQRIYKSFGQEISGETRAKMEAYLAEQKGYRINRHNLSEKETERLDQELAFLFERHPDLLAQRFNQT